MGLDQIAAQDAQGSQARLKKRVRIFWGGLFALLFFYHQRALIPAFQSSQVRFSDIFSAFVPPLAVFAVLGLAIIGWGSLLVAGLVKESADPWEKPFLALAFGTALLGIFFLGLALAGFYTRPVLYLFLAIGSGLGLRFMFKWFSESRSAPLRSEPLTVLEESFIALTLWALAMGFLKSFVPPIDVDSLSYHLALPKLWLKDGKMNLIPWLTHSQYPSQMETLYGMACSLKQDTAAQLLHWLFGAGTTALILVWKDLPLTRPARLFAASAFSTAPVVYHFICRAHTDCSSAYFSLMMILCLQRSLSAGRSTAWAFSAGLFGGTLAAMKYPGAAFAAAAGLTLLLANWREWKRFAAFALGAVLIAAPWYARTWIWTGNPVWPFLTSVFPTAFWSPELDRYFKHYFTRPLALLDWLKTFRHIWEPNAAPLAAQYFLLPFLGLALIRKFRWPRYFVFWVPAVVLYTLITLNGRENWWRFLIVIFPLMCALAGWLFFEGASRFRAAERLKYAALILFLPAFFIRFPYPPTSLLGLRDRAHPEDPARISFLRAALPGFFPAWEIANRLPGEVQVGLYQDSQGYYLDRPYRWLDPLHQSVFSFEECTPDTLTDALWAAGITHIFMGPPHSAWIPLPDFALRATLVLEACLARHGEVLYEGPRRIRLVALKPPSPPAEGKDPLPKGEGERVIDSRLKNEYK